MRWPRMAAHSHRNRMSRDDLNEDEELVGYFNVVWLPHEQIDIFNMVDEARRTKFISKYPFYSFYTV